MPTKKPRAMITFNDENLYEQVNSYRFEHRFKSQNDAVMDLINKGIKAALGETTVETCAFSTDEQRLITEYRTAPTQIKEAAHNILMPYIKSKAENRT